MYGDRRWLDRGMAPSYLVFVSFAGIALLASIPLPVTLESMRLIAAPLEAPILYYFLPVLSAVLGMNLGAISAFRRERRWVVTILGGRVALAHLFVLPFIVLSRALIPGHDGSLVLAVLLSWAVGLLWAVVSRLTEENVRRTAAAKRMLKYGALLVYALLPLPIVAAVSPAYGGAALLGELTAARAAWAILPVIIALAVFVPWLRRRLPGGRRV